MKILFHMRPDLAHTRASIPLARTLAEHGHEIIYTAVADRRIAMEQWNLRCEPMHVTSVWPDALHDLERMPAGVARDLAWVELEDRIADEYFRGHVERDIVRIAPDVVIADTSWLSPLPFVLHHLGIPCLQLSTSLPKRFDSTPPLTCPLTPDDPAHLARAMRWSGSCLHRTVAGCHASMLVTWAVERYATAFGYPAKHISFDSALDPALALHPEATLGSRAFDFDRDKDLESIYLAMPVAHRPASSPARHSSPTGNRPILLVSLSPSVGPNAQGEPLSAAVVTTLRARPDWQAIICSQHPLVTEALYHSIPDNVLWMNEAPTSSLVRDASVVLTHGDLIQVREALQAHVPLIVTPHLGDQFGNAARVEWHDVGIRLPSDLLSGDIVAELIERVLDDRQRLVANAKRLEDARSRERDDARTVARIEALANASSATARVREISDVPSNANRSFEPAIAGWVLSASANVPTHAVVHCDLSRALCRARGTWLHLVQPSDDTTRGGAWALDIREPLFDYACWCANMVLDSTAITRVPERAEMFRRLLARHRALRASGATFDQLNEVFLKAWSPAVQRWHAGYGVAALALSPLGHLAARRARLQALSWLARVAVGEHAGTVRGALMFRRRYAELVHRFDAEWQRHIDSHLEAQGLQYPRPSWNDG